MRELTPEQVAEALERVFARPEFTERSVPAVLRWLNDQWAAVKAWIVSLLQSLLQLEATGRVLFWIIIALLVAALVAALVHIAYTIAFAFRGRDRAGSPATEAAEEAGFVNDTDPAAWEARARAAAAAGRLRDAALALYHAVILRLDASGAVRFLPGKTPGEYRREARRAGELGGRFDLFLRIFHPVAFGPRAPEVGAWTSLREAASELGADA